LPLIAQSVAHFYAGVLTALNELNSQVHIHEIPNEISGAVPSSQDQSDSAYDPDAVRRI
jgi:hypothetical protein